MFDTFCKEGIEIIITEDALGGAAAHLYVRGTLVRYDYEPGPYDESLFDDYDDNYDPDEAMTVAYPAMESLCRLVFGDIFKGRAPSESFRVGNIIRVLQSSENRSDPARRISAVAAVVFSVDTARKQLFVGYRGEQPIKGVFRVRFGTLNFDEALIEVQ